jgi:hypothetical protein
LQDKSGLAAKWTKPIRVAVSGAAGSIANHLLFKVCALKDPRGGCASSLALLTRP